MKHSTVALLVLCIALLATAGPGQTQSRADSRIRAARRPVADQFIVVLADGVDANDMAADAEVRHSGRRKHVFRHAISGFSMRLKRADAARLAADPRVRFVEEDGVIELAQQPTWGLDRIDQRFRPVDGLYSPGALGTGVPVHVIDTGIRITHLEFGGRAFITADYVDDDDDDDPLDIEDDDAIPLQPDAMDCHGHGTHVAGTIGGATYGVAKGVTLFAHRVFRCNGVGSLSDLIAAIDAVTATTERPAVANLSLGGEASVVLDEVIRRSVESGITVVVAAGNSNSPAANYSPARVAEAITVGATDAADVKASFSNYGASLDLFAPGVAVLSAGRSHDAATAVMSGTSMAAPHVAGVAALLLEQQPGLTPFEVETVLGTAATPNVVTNAGIGSPNLLLYSAVTRSAPVVSLLRPADGERVLSGLPYAITWDASDVDGLEALDVLLSTDGGLTFQPLPECAALAASEQQCIWAEPSPVTTTARIRVLARDLTGDVAFDQSMANFSVVVRPELVVTQVSNPPARLAPGNSFEISDTVSNFGNTDAGVSSTRYYLSLDGTKSVDDLRLSVVRSVPGIGVGNQSTGAVVATLSTTMAIGVYTVFACADDTAVIAEADETNNCLAASTPLAVELPDLIEDTLNGVAAAASPGSTFSLTGTVRNQGTTIAIASTTRFYFSTDNSKGAGDRLVSGTRAVSALSPGGFLTASTTITVPTDLPLGSHYVLSCADDTLKVRETNEANNCLASASTVQIVRPDLALSAVGNPPAAIAPATSFSVAASVHNPSPVKAGASTLRFYLSEDTLKGGDVLLSGTRSVPALTAGLTSTATTTLTVPATTPLGTFYLLACADDLLKVAESDEQNCRASASTVLVTRPDLAQTSVTNPPVTATPGMTFVVSDTVHNTSPVTAIASTTRYYFSVDALKDSSDILLVKTRAVPVVAAGGTSTANITLTVPLTTPLNRYYLFACADDLAKIVEADETNNCRNAVGTVLVVWPDLVTTEISTPPPFIAPPQSFDVTDVVVNEGGHPAVASTTRYHLSADTLRDASDILLSATRTVPALTPGQASTGTRTVTVPSTVAHGRYVLLACADDLNKVAELDNVNNCLASSDFVVGPPNARPVAAAGNDVDVPEGTLVQLDGTGSSDGDGDPLSYAWTLLVVPAGSSAVLSSATSAAPSFVADRAGQYVVQLVVHDGREFSVSDVVTNTVGTVTRFVAIGDTGKGNAGQYAGAALLENTCERSHCDFVVLLGDNIYSSGVDSVTDEQFNTKFEFPYANVDVPFYAVLGNHDYGNGGRGDEFHKGQYQVDYTALSTKWRMPAHFYRFATGEIEFFGLDTNMQMYGQDAQQRLDVAAWLAGSSARWKIALGHHPYRSNGPHGNAGSYNGTSGVPVTSGDGVKSFMEEVVCGRADLLLSGHEHNLQWLQPNGTCAGTELIVSGAGAAPNGGAPNGSNETYFQVSQLGFVYVVVTAEQLTAEFVGATGQTLFVKTITKAP